MLVEPTFAKPLAGGENPFMSVEKAGKISEFYDLIHTERRAAKGALLLEVDQTSTVGQTVLAGVAALEVAEVARPLLISGPGVSLGGSSGGDAVSDFFEEILKNGMMQCVSESALTGFSGGSAVSSRTLLYLPNPRFSFFLLLFHKIIRSDNEKKNDKNSFVR